MQRMQIDAATQWKGAQNVKGTHLQPITEQQTGQQAVDQNATGCLALPGFLPFDRLNTSAQSSFAYFVFICLPLRLAGAGTTEKAREFELRSCISRSSRMQCAIIIGHTMCRGKPVKSTSLLSLDQHDRSRLCCMFRQTNGKPFCAQSSEQTKICRFVLTTLG